MCFPIDRTQRNIVRFIYKFNTEDDEEEEEEEEEHDKQRE